MDIRRLRTIGMVRKRGRVIRIVRRVHLYTGLVFLPWVIFFGLSGMFMNHPQLGSLETLGRRGGEISEMLGYTPVDPNHLADQIVTLINTDGQQKFQRTSVNDAVYDGALSFQGELAGGGMGMVSINPQDGSAAIRKLPASSKGDSPDFVKSDLSSVNGFSQKPLQMMAEKLLSEEGEQVMGVLTPSPKGAAELRFRVASAENGKTWNVAMNLLSGSLTAREIGTGTPDFHAALTRLHKIHNYPEQMSARWIWTLVADMTGITMVFWGLSGVIMWWQMKSTRLIGMISLCLAGVLAASVFVGTYSNLYWSPQQGGRPAAVAPSKTVTPSDITPQSNSSSESGRKPSTSEGR